MSQVLVIDVFGCQISTKVTTFHDQTYMQCDVLIPLITFLKPLKYEHD